MHLACPHCKNRIEVVEDNAPGEVLCPSCGSSFQVEAPTTTLTIAPRTLGKFELIVKVGVGAFGSVYKARDPKLDRVVAVKVPRMGNLTSDEDRDRFVREARSVAQLRHPSIVSVHEVGESDGTPYLVSEFVEGITLADYLTAHRVSFEDASQLIATLAETLQYAHDQGVVHRDVKPSNIMLEKVQNPIPQNQNPQDNTDGKHGSATSDIRLWTPKLMDFGLSLVVLRAR